MLLLLFCLNLLTSNHAAKNVTKPKLFDLGNLCKLPGQIAADLSNWWAQAQAPGTVVTIGEENVDVCKTIKKQKNLPNVQSNNEDSCDKFCQNNGTEAAALSEESCFCVNKLPEIVNKGAAKIEAKCSVKFFNVTAKGHSFTGPAGDEEALEDEDSGVQGEVVGLVVGAVVLVGMVAVAVVFVLVKRRSLSIKREEERTDINPVYATYEVHDDPVAEVAKNLDQSLSNDK